MLMPYALPDPASYDVCDLNEWTTIQADLERRISHYHGELGTKFAAHHMRVAADGLGFLMFLGYPMAACLNVKSALLIHDIGKTHDLYDPEIWTLPHRPTEEQRAEKRLHTRRGVEILDKAVADTPVEHHKHVDLCRAIILYHHERLNGSMFENRTDLPEWLQAVAIVDTFDGDRIKHPHQDHRRSPQETIERMMADGDDGEKYDGAFDHHLLEKFAEYKL